MKFLIPSYRRCGAVKTVGMLQRYGVPIEDITIGVQTEDDLRAYSSNYPCRVIFNEAHNVAGNRNGLLRSVPDGELFCMLDDDITGYSRAYVLSDGYRVHHRKMDEHGFTEMLQIVSIAFDSGAKLVGLANSTSNIILAHDIARYGRFKPTPLVKGGTMFSYGGSGLQFDEQVEFGEDYEAAIRLFYKGEGVCCATMYVVNHPPNGTSEGGCEQLYKKGKRYIHQAMYRDIVSKYSPLVKFRTNAPDETGLAVSFLGGREK